MVKYGFQQSFQYAMEDSPKVPTSSVRFMLPGFITGETKIDTKGNLHEFRSLKQPSDTDMRAVDDIQTSKYEYSWSISYIPLKRTSAPKYDFRHFHNNALNNSSSTAAGGGWTYGTSITTNLRSFTIFKEIDNLQHQLNGCFINRLSGRSSLDNPVEMTAEGHATAASFADLAHTDASSLRDGTPFMWADVRVYIDGSLATNCTAFEYTVNNDASPNYVLGNKEPDRIGLGGRTIEISLTRQYNDQTQYAAMKANTAKSVTIRMADTANVDIQFRNIKWDEHPIPGDATPRNVLIHQLKGRAESIATT